MRDAWSMPTDSPAAEQQELSLPDALYRLKDIKEQCSFVLTQGVGVEARTLATLIIDMVDARQEVDEDDDDNT